MAGVAPLPQGGLPSSHQDYPKCPWGAVSLPSIVVLAPGFPARGNWGDQFRPKDLTRVGLRTGTWQAGPGSVDRMLQLPEVPSSHPGRAADRLRSSEGIQGLRVGEACQSHRHLEVKARGPSQGKAHPSRYRGFQLLTWRGACSVAMTTKGDEGEKPVQPVLSLQVA